MKKKTIEIKKSTLWWLVIIIILIWFFWPVDYSSPSYDLGLEEEIIKDNFLNIEEYHFSNMPLTYTINIDSSPSAYEIGGNDEYEIQRIKWALNIIENATDGLVSFQEEYFGTTDLILNGFPPLEDSDPQFITEGFAGPIETEDNLIMLSEVDLFPVDVALWGGETSLYVEGGWIWELTEYDLRETISWEVEDCKEFPNTEIHEILHALGVGHKYNDSYSIMAPIKHRIQSCKTKKIDEDIVSCLKYIYSNGEIKGDCSNLNMYPWFEEEVEEINDFKWETLPITYSTLNCSERQKKNLQEAEKVIEEYTGYNLYSWVGWGEQINFHCQDSFDNILLNKETDFWDATVYFPSAQPYFNFDEEGNIGRVKIILFAQDKKCGGIEIHELLHGIGLRNHYGRWMEYETEMCDTRTLVIGREAIEKIKEIYNLD